jgi:hypothetical protein
LYQRAIVDTRFCEHPREVQYAATLYNRITAQHNPRSIRSQLIKEKTSTVLVVQLTLLGREASGQLLHESDAIQERGK